MIGLVNLALLIIGLATLHWRGTMAGVQVQVSQFCTHYVSNDTQSEIFSTYSSPCRSPVIVYAGLLSKPQQDEGRVSANLDGKSPSLLTTAAAAVRLTPAAIECSSSNGTAAFALCFFALSQVSTAARNE